MLTAQVSANFPQMAGIVLNGGFDLPTQVAQLIDGLGTTMPIVATSLDTSETTRALTSVRGRLQKDSPRKVATALALFDERVDGDLLLDRLEVARTTAVTPLMFEHQLIDMAVADRRHIVLPEGDDDRILQAADIVLRRRIADLTILGEARDVQRRAALLGVDISGAAVLSPTDPELRGRFAAAYHERRKHKGIDLERARDIVIDVSYFGTMMVELGLADGMVSGAAHTTAHTIRPALEVVRTAPDVSVVSSVFFMCLRDQVLVYGDCAVNPDPTAAQLADIALASARTAAAFGVEPRVAMLSYSTGASGAGSDVDKVIEATAMVRERAPSLLVEGPIQYDAAIDAAVARTKLPGSQVAGRATVFVFPDLNTGNNTYKAVQRSAGALAVGPILQGLRKPVNDLSRGALVRDIVNTIAITAIQAQTVGADPDELLRPGGERRVLVAEVQPGRRRRPGSRPPRGRSSGSVSRPGASSTSPATTSTSTSGPSPTTRRPCGRRWTRSRRTVRRSTPPASWRWVIASCTAASGSPSRRSSTTRSWRRSSRLVPLAPLHNPANLEGIAVARKLFPDLPQVAVFDTAYHQTMPPVAYTYAVPLAWRDEHAIRRYGFHGTSHAYVARAAARCARAARPEDVNVIVLHLGNGASATAVRGGVSVDTSMGLTPLEGLVMGTRSGDLDPAIHMYLHRSLGWSLEDIDDAPSTGRRASRGWPVRTTSAR